MADRVLAGLECLPCSSRRRRTLRHVETPGRIAVRKVVAPRKAAEEAIETFRRLVVDRGAMLDRAAVGRVAAGDPAAVADRVVITDSTAVAVAASSNVQR